jgi:Protein of unknown function (DUF3500)
VQALGARAGRLNDDAAAARMTEIRNGLASTYFAWYGPTTAGNPAYYRVQGPALWVEFAPQGGGGPGAGGLGLGGALTTDHVHSNYRDPTNEYGSRWSGQQADASQ